MSPGTLAVERIGDGLAALNRNAVPVYLDIFNPEGSSPVLSIALPKASPRPTSAPFNLMDSGNATSDGYLTRSANGLQLQISGYNGILGDAGIVNSTNTRTIGVINGAGVVDTSSSVAMFETDNFCSVASVDGTAFWGAGSSSPPKQGVVYVNGGSVITLSMVNARCVNIFNNQLYYSTGKGTCGIYALGSGLPTSGTPSASLVIPVGGTAPSPFAFQFDPAFGVAYVADDRTIANGGGIIRFTNNGSSWSSNYTLGTMTGTAASYGARGLTVDWTGASPIVYATTAEASMNRVIRIVDTGPDSAATLVATAPANTVFRGLDFTPMVGLAGPISQGNPGGAMVCVGASDVTYTITNVIGATGYSWTVPAGASITAGQGTTNIVVAWGSAGGSVTVTPTNFFGSGEASSLTVTVNSLVTPSVGISALPGTTNCPGTPVTFSAMAVDGGSAPSYQWQRSGIDVAEATNSTYVSSGWTDGEVITCKLIPSQEICATAAFAISPGLIVGVSPPMLSIPGGTNKSVESTDAWTFDEPASVDACGTNTIMVLSTTTNRTCGAGYVATRVWQAVNPFSNSATCTQVVTVVDATPPVILCPSNMTVECSSPWEFGTPLAADRGLGGVLVYDNSVNDLMTRLETGTNEVGNEIILAGTERYLQGFSYEFWSTNLIGDPWFEGTNVTVRLRFYANDGTNLNGYAVPGTLLYDSGEFGLGTGTTPRATVLYDEFDLWLFAPHPLIDALPPSFTWTVQFAGLGEHDRVGVDLYSPPVIGQSYGDFWVRTDDGWELREVPGLATDAAAQAFASTNRVTISVLGTVTNVLSPGVFLATRTWRATDACGNYSDCSQTVTVVDTSPPVISRYPPNVALAAGTNCLATLCDLTAELVATDSCSQVFVSQQPPPGTELGPGNYVITFVASDTASNSSTCALLLTVTSPPGATTSIHISEFMAKNTLTITDDDTSYSDWIEIHNNGLCPISLEGWALTDDVTQLAKWRFPATNIAGGEFMIVWASDKNRRVPGAPLHTNFKLSEGGEYLALVQPDGVTIVSQFYPTFPPQLPDVSYGVPTDGLSHTYLAWPTPGLPDSPGTNFVVAGLAVRPGRGWYTNSVSVSMESPTAGVTMYYTTNGSVPGPTNGFKYTVPLVFRNTTVLRATAYRPGYVSASVSHTYIFPNQVVYQTGAGFPTTWGVDEQGRPVPSVYGCSSSVVNDPQWGPQIPAALLSLPAVSVVMNTDDMFGTYGVYSNPFIEDWEQPCSVEYFRPDAQPGFQIDCAIRMHGNTSRSPSATPKHNLRLKFNDAYGPPKLRFNLYPGSPVSEFESLVLHASHSDHWIGCGLRAQMHRDQWCADTQREAGGFGTHGTYVHLYINGLYWGLYNLGERPNDAYAAAYLGGQKSDYDTFNGGELKSGTTGAWNEMIALATRGITNETAYSNICYYLNVPHYIDYLLVNFYAANQDWGPNWWTGGSVTHGVPFHFFSWDAEQSLLYVTNDFTGASFYPMGELYWGLRQYPEFRRLFGDHAHRLLFNHGLLTPERCTARWMQRAQEIDLAIISESARWSMDPSWYAYWYWGGEGRVPTYTDWLQEQNSLLTNWFPQRTGIVIAQLRNAGMYPAVDAPVIAPHNGIIAGSLAVTITPPLAATVYYTVDGTDPRLPDGSVSPDALVCDEGSGVILTLTNETQLRARALATNTWSALVEARYRLATEVEMRVSSIAYDSDGSVRLGFQAWPGVTYTLLAATSLNPAASGYSSFTHGSIGWEAIATLLPLPDGTCSFTDTNAPHYPVRFYRLAWP